VNLSLRSLDVAPAFLLMKIAEDVREYAAQQQIDEEAALEVAMKEKAGS